MTILFPIIAFVLAFAAGKKAIGYGLCAVLFAGYFNGVIRANYLSVYTTFMFDAALAGLYASALVFHAHRFRGVFRTIEGRFTLALIAWPAGLTLVPANHILVQAVALRATVWFLPVFLLATRIGEREKRALTWTLAGLNLIALAVAVYLYRNGVPSLYPLNPVTSVIYLSTDVADGQFRIPSTFLSAHAYGGAMALSLALLLGRSLAPGLRPVEWILLLLGIVAAVIGILMCGARQPLIVAGLTMLAGLALSRFSKRLLVAVLLIAAGGAWVYSSNERFQRASTLDVEAVQGRVQGSANHHFLELLVENPLGAGMGSSVGTSIPYFLSDHAPEPVGMENEYSRILVDQGWVGLLLWLAFLVWVHHRPPQVAGRGRLDPTLLLCFAVTFIVWSTAFIGTGTLAAIPGSTLLLTLMGVSVGGRTAAYPRRSPELSRPVGRRANRPTTEQLSYEACWPQPR